MKHLKAGRAKYAAFFAGVALLATAAVAGTTWVPTTPTSTGPRTVTSGQTVALGNIFGNARPGTITGCKYEDQNGNGVRDPGEPGIQGIVIRLTGTTGAGSAITLSTTTDATGCFSFNNLPPGSYNVSEDLAASGGFAGAPNAGGASAPPPPPAPTPTASAGNSSPCGYCGPGPAAGSSTWSTPRYGRGY